ncbi:MAG: glycosyltransferase family 39 protein [Eubacteriales bacterium]|nr:glycosyltransferase family 39 protein [Eubacteriales bacterium]
MTKNKKLLSVFLGVLLILAFAMLYIFVVQKNNNTVVYNVNLLKNGNFEALDGSGFPIDWDTEAYIPTTGVTEYSSAEGVDGLGVKIINNELNDARFLQRVKVIPNTNYRFSGSVKASATGGKGANLSIEGLYVFSESVYESDGFTHIEMYGRTGSKQTDLTVFLRLGGYSGESVGTAVFDNVSLEAVKDVPAGVSLISWEIPENTPEVDVNQAEASPAWPMLLIMVLLYCLLSIKAVKFINSKENALKQESQNHKYFIWLLLFAAVAVRLLTALFVRGYSVDVGCFTSWANQMAQVGPGGFYHSGIYADYPPGYMLALWPIGIIGRLLGGANEFMVKMPSIICDIAIVYIIYREAQKVGKSKVLSILYAGIYAFNPVSIIAGAGWGQVDSVLSLLLLLTLIFAMQSQWKWALPIYVLAVLTKPQALMVGPFGLVAFVVDIIKAEKNKLKDALLGIVFSMLVALIVILPFQVNEQGFSWLIDLYSGTMTYYTGATVNATNIYFLFGLNWLSVENAAPLALRIVAPLSLIIPVVVFILKENKQIKRELTYWSAVLTLSLLPMLVIMAVPISLSLMGYLFMASSFIPVAAMYIKKKDIQWLPFFGAVVLILFSSLGTMMHERYMFPALVLLIYFYVKFKDKRVLALILLLSVVMFMNVGIVLDRSHRIGGAAAHLDAPHFNIASDSAAMEYINAALTVVTASFSLYLSLVLGKKEAVAQPLKIKEKTNTSSEKPAIDYINKKSIDVKLNKRDWIIMLAVCLVYSVVAFADLGANKAPQTALVSKEKGEEAVFDLGESKTYKLIYYPGIHWDTNNIFIAASGDSLDNMAEFSVKAGPGECFNWQTHTEVSDALATPVTFSSIPVLHSGRYLKIRADKIGLYLYEIMALDANTGEKLPLKLVSGAGENLIDEQDVLDGAPTWRNGMYFDEIYHARTGFEQLNALKGKEPNSIYEVSHPPLGKVFMTLSIAIFGMTPFAWRLPGAIAGVLMLPGMYLMGKLFTRKRYLAALPMLFMALDGMHFAQTRIATIDSFVTLFIIWATYYMFRYVFTNIYEKPFKQGAKLLFLSGLFMGLGCASKWTGCYAGLGLAVIFFINLFRQIKAGLKAQKEVASGDKDALKIKVASTWKNNTVKTLLLCVLFFVIIPLVIYYVSFYPVFVATPGGLTVDKVMRANESMYNYHSAPGRGADHPFASKWYQWPLSQKPMYYYAAPRIDGTGGAIWAFGNPAVWWLSTAALLVIISVGLLKKFKGAELNLPKGDRRGALILIAYFAQYLPWVFVPRGTYIYHYFPALPFAIMALVYVLEMLDFKRPKLGKRISFIILFVVVLMFIGFFPYVSGERVSTAWLDLMRWFPGIWY